MRLVLFRRGLVDEGREAYEQAVTALAGLQQRDLAALANLFWAREELLSGTPRAGHTVHAAAERVRTARAPEARLWAERLADLLAARAVAAVLPGQRQ